jgi:hypothetical protein
MIMMLKQWLSAFCSLRPTDDCLKKMYSQNNNNKKIPQKGVASVSTVMCIVLLIDVLMFETCHSTEPNVKFHWLINSVR